MSEWGNSKQEWASSAPVGLLLAAHEYQLMELWKVPLLRLHPTPTLSENLEHEQLSTPVSSLGDFSVQLRLITNHTPVVLKVWSPDHQHQPCLELVRNANVQPPPQTLHQKTLGLGPRHLCLNKLCSFSSSRPGKDPLQLFLKSEATSVIWQSRDTDGWLCSQYCLV